MTPQALVELIKQLAITCEVAATECNALDSFCRGQAAGLNQAADMVRDYIIMKGGDN